MAWLAGLLVLELVFDAAKGDFFPLAPAGTAAGLA